MRARWKYWAGPHQSQFQKWLGGQYWYFCCYIPQLLSFPVIFGLSFIPKYKLMRGGCTWTMQLYDLGPTFLGVHFRCCVHTVRILLEDKVVVIWPQYFVQIDFVSVTYETPRYTQNMFGRREFGVELVQVVDIRTYIYWRSIRILQIILPKL